MKPIDPGEKCGILITPWRIAFEQIVPMRLGPILPLLVDDIEGWIIREMSELCRTK